MPEHDLLTEAEASAYLGSAPATTLRQWRYLGKGPPYVKISHGHVRYSAAALDLWLAERTVEPAP